MESSSGSICQRAYSCNLKPSIRRKCYNIRPLCSRSSSVNSSRQSKTYNRIPTYRGRSSMPPTSSKKTHLSSTRFSARRVPIGSREFSAAKESEMANCSRSSSLSLKGALSARQLKMRSESCRWASVSQLSSATKHSIFRIDCGSSWNWWMVARSHQCLKSCKGSILKTSASIACGRPAKAWSIYTGRTSSTGISSRIISSSKPTARLNLPTLATR